jgi:hypothetical protein
VSDIGLDLREQIARIDLALANVERAQAETHKFVAEERKLAAEARKRRMDRLVAPALAIAAVGGAVGAVLVRVLSGH